MEFIESFVGQAPEASNQGKYAGYCGSAYKGVNPQTGMEKTYRQFCNDVVNCSNCRSFKMDAHKRGLKRALIRNDEIFIIFSTDESIVREQTEDLSKEQYKKYPFANGSMLALICVRPEILESGGSYYQDENTIISIVNEDEWETILPVKAILPVKGRRLSGSLYKTYERNPKEEPTEEEVRAGIKNNIPKNSEQEQSKTPLQKQRISFTAVRPARGTPEEIERCVAMTMVQTRNWRPSEINIDIAMQAWVDVLEENYTKAGLGTKERQKFAVTIDQNNINWLDWTCDEILVSIKEDNDLLYRSIIDTISLYEGRELPKKPMPTFFESLWST